MTLDADVVAVSPSANYHAVHRAGVPNRWNRKPSRKGTGFVQPLRAHTYWHIEASYRTIKTVAIRPRRSGSLQHAR